MDLAHAEVYATMLDEGRYLCSERTMYGILAANQGVPSDAISSATPTTHVPNRSRRSRTNCGVGTLPNFLGRPSGTYFYLYVVLNVFSRYVVG